MASIHYLIAGESIIERSYQQAQGKPFSISTPGKQHVMVVSKTHIAELGHASSDKLSLHAVAKEVRVRSKFLEEGIADDFCLQFLQPRHTMGGFEWRDERGVDPTLFVRALRSIREAALPALLPKLEPRIEQHIEEDLAKAHCHSGRLSVSVSSFVGNLAARIGCLVFFGSEPAEDREFLEILANVVDEVFVGAELFRLLPGSIAAFATKFLLRKNRLSQRFFDYLYLLAERQGQEESSKRNIFQDLIQNSPPDWDIARCCHETIALWIGAFATTKKAVTFTVLDLYSHPEAAIALRDELSDSAVQEFIATGKGLPLLDSFLQESMRFSNSEATTVHRKALCDFTFSDGLKVAKGDWVCVPWRAMMRDSKLYGDSATFSAFRFRDINSIAEKARSSRRPTQLSDSGDDWLLWGTGRIKCPGRFYGVALMKLVLARLLRSYDCSLRDHAGSRSFCWRAAVVPKSGVQIQIKRREMERARSVDTCT